MKTKLLIFTFLFLFFSTRNFAQDLSLKGNQGGLFSFGLRNTVSAFDHSNLSIIGFGFGGQFRIQFANRVNSEWFGEYTRGSIMDGRASRTDYHIGWSVMYYFTDKVAPFAKPYILAGHCFDQTLLVDNSNRNNRIVKHSSAIQAGAGIHLNLTDRLDLTFIAQYMFHLGKDVHADLENNVVHFERVKTAGIEGHALFTIGLNYKIVDLWGNSKKK